jgi:chaperonin GroEL
MDLELNKEITTGENCSRLLLEAINELADTVLLTYGPNGSTVIIADSNGKPYVTKDGVSVANYITFENPIKNIAANLIKQAAQNTVKEAGDGTTTSICLAQAFINKGFELLEKYNYNKIKEELDILEAVVLETLSNMKKTLLKEDIINVATISANNDNIIGELIQQAFNNSNTVKVEEGNKEYDELITLKGMRLNSGYFDKAFINNPSKQSIEYNDIPLLVIEGHLDDLKPYAKIIEQNPKGIAIIADHFTDSVISILRDNYNRGLLNIALLKSPGFATHRKDLMNDITLFAGGKIGHISSLKATADTILLIKENIPTEALELANKLKESLSDLTDTQKELTQQRIDNLSGSISVIKVGGKSELEMKERKDRMDDAVLAVGCALEEGIVEGGGYALKDCYFNNLFSGCLTQPFFLLNEHRYTPETGIIKKDMYKEGIIDPVKVTRVALQNAISIAKVILSTKAVVINNRLWI